MGFTALAVNLRQQWLELVRVAADQEREQAAAVEPHAGSQIVGVAKTSSPSLF